MYKESFFELIAIMLKLKTANVMRSEIVRDGNSTPTLSPKWFPRLFLHPGYASFAILCGWGLCVRYSNPKALSTNYSINHGRNMLASTDPPISYLLFTLCNCSVLTWGRDSFYSDHDKYIHFGRFSSEAVQYMSAVRSPTSLMQSYSFHIF